MTGKINYLISLLTVPYLKSKGNVLNNCINSKTKWMKWIPPLWDVKRAEYVTMTWLREQLHQEAASYNLGQNLLTQLSFVVCHPGKNANFCQINDRFRSPLIQCCLGWHQNWSLFSLVVQIAATAQWKVEGLAWPQLLKRWIALSDG